MSTARPAFYMAMLFFLLCFDALAACKNAVGMGSVVSGILPGTTQDVIIPLPFNSISPIPFSMNDYGSKKIMTVKHSISARVECDREVLYLAQTLESPMSISGVMHQDTIPIYKSNVNGIGVSLHNDSNPNFKSPYSNEVHIVTSHTSPWVQINNGVGITLNLWALSGNTSHGVFDGASLPRAIFYITDTPGGVFDSNAAIVARFSFSGQVIFNSPTCLIEDREIFLGTYPVSKFSGAKITDWVEASVTMKCDRAFSSSSNSFKSSSHPNYGPETSIGSTNYYRTSIDAVNGFIDSARGIMAIDSGGASGVAVQISRGQYEDNFSSLHWDTAYNVEQNTGTFLMPLYARIIQTESTVTAGKVNSKLLYTVEYK